MIWIFILHSVVGWGIERLYAVVRRRNYVNRGITKGPMCFIYGMAGVFEAVILPDITGEWFFAFLGCGIIFCGCEWITSKAYERLFHKRFWDYSAHRYNIDGYLSLWSAIGGGIFGLVGIEWVNPWFGGIIRSIPRPFDNILMWGILICFAVDISVNTIILRGQTSKIQKWIDKRERGEVFAAGCSAYKVFWLFIIGAVVGDLVETVFCRITSGVWMSRTSLVWGDFSVVWGIGIAGATWILYNYRNKSDGYLFVMGTILGGAFEYVCSVFTEIVFGQVFWDYSSIPFNLGGRINLLYCFFWGIAAVVWLKKLYPKVSGLIELVPISVGRAATFIMAVFMALNIGLSVMVLTRYDNRLNGLEASNKIERWIDIHYDNNVVKSIYPNSKHVE